MKSLRVLQDLALVPEGKSCALIIRHADRDGQVDRLVPKDESLNGTGRRRATELGKALKRFDLLRLLSSPIGRCVETCERISEGYGEKVEVETTEFLGMRCPTMLKPDEAYRLMGSMGLYSFTESYVAGKLDPKVVRSCEEGAKMLFHYAIESIRHKDNLVTAIVTHDMLITPAMVKYFGFDVRKAGLVPFLDGMVLYSSDYGYRVAHENRILKVTKEGEPKP
ncbi:MAG TPA: histidine phosphatase family protein [Methanomassiliicoccales archaeon]|nr:histidine phosphatase family protein [Methanomassiliicoccales archaeon]